MSEDSEPAAFSNVALTLISIIVALGIEHLLGQISALLADAEGAASFLIAAQGLTTFGTIGAIWITYATMLMTSAWEPRFQDFFAPLLILSLLYFWINAIGSSEAAWFYLAAIGWAVPAYGTRFGLPRPVAALWKPSSREALTPILCHLSLSLLSLAGGIVSQLSAPGAATTAVFVSLLGAIQLVAAWLQFQAWRALKS